MGSWIRTVGRGLATRVLHHAGMLRPGGSRGDLLTVVALHRVLPGHLLREYPLPEIAIGTDAFEHLVQFLGERYTCGPLTSTFDRWSAGERPARPFLAITFDDGQRDNFEFARPILDRAGMRATFYVPVDAVDSGALLWHDRLAYAVTACLQRGSRAAVEAAGLAVPEGGGRCAVVDACVQQAKRMSAEDRARLVARLEEEAGATPGATWDGMMTWEQVRSLATDGHEIGSHTLSHPLLTGCTDAELEREVAVSRGRVAAGSGSDCVSFCYPNGTHDARVVAAVRRAGYRTAVTSVQGLGAPGADPLSLSRCEFQEPHAASPHEAAYRLSSLRARRLSARTRPA